MEGGYSEVNCIVLLSQTKEMVQRLQTCNRVVKTILPIGKIG